MSLFLYYYIPNLNIFSIVFLRIYSLSFHLIIQTYLEEPLRNGWDDVAVPPLFTGFQAPNQSSSP